MRFIKGLSILVISLTLLISSATTFAQSEQGKASRVFGHGQPHSTQDLPPGHLKRRLESLPPHASAKALRWLQDFSFPEADLETLQVDDEGSVFYGDTILPDPEHIENALSGPTLPAEAPVATLDDAFSLHSRPGAANVVFIDFDGATITGTAWNDVHTQLDARAFNTEGDASTFSTTERTRIVDIWHRVSEDLSAYDIDVTTEEPAVFNSNTGTILVTHSVDANDNLIQCDSCGGVAYVNVFGRSDYPSYYSPALVFFDKLGSGNPTYVAEASSHEFGHNLGLSHDGTSSVGYYQGQGSGLVSWAPIMGNSYYNNITEWSKGEYTDANQTQDDLAIIDGKLGYLSDDHGDTVAGASALVVDPDGSVVSSNPELDPHNTLTENKGVINSSSDVDVFSFVAGAGPVNLTVTPAWDAFYRSTSRRGANLDIEIELQDLNGAFILSNNPTDDTSAGISTTVSAGTYHLTVTGVGNGNPLTGYSDYNSMGQYFINGSVPVAAADTTKPTPNPMTWANEPAATGQTSISMTASTASDETSAVEYNFTCVTGGSGCSSSGWQSSNSYSATGLVASTGYTFQVKARDQADNQTAPSVSASATTDSPPPPPPPPATPTDLMATVISETMIDLSWTDNASNETAYRVERSAGGQNNYSTIANLGVDAESFSDGGLLASTSYDYRVAAVNVDVDSDFATTSGTTDDPPPPPPFVNYAASSETPMAGSVSGNYTNTQDLDGATQSITERQSGGKPANRHTFLEHRWVFNIAAGDTVTANAVARSSGSSDGDDFRFEYSLNNGTSFTELFTVTETSNMTLSAPIPSHSSGVVLIRVVDTDQTSGHREANMVTVDHLFIQVGSPSSDPPIGDPSELGADMASSSRIDLTWVDGTENESGFIIEHSLTGGAEPAEWTERAGLPAGSTSYSDTGLAAETKYFYRVSAYNSNGVSAYATANATTDVAPAMSLSASGYKVKGKHHVSLSWSGSSSVDIYRNGSVIISGFSGTSHDDNIGTKGGITYTHKVCEAGTSTCSNTTTTVF